jgi:hypothetical protein
LRTQHRPRLRVHAYQHELSTIIRRHRRTQWDAMGTGQQAPEVGPNEIESGGKK